MRAWEEFLELQEIELGKETVSKWLRTIKIKSFDACNLYLEVQDSFQGLWFEEHLRNKVEKTLVNGNNKKIKVHLIIPSEEPIRKTKGKSKKKNNFTFETVFKLEFDPLDPLFQIDNFIISKQNLLIEKLIQEILSNHQKRESAQFSAVNPIYIHSCDSAGKTHLLMALAQTLKKQGLNTIYTKADTFTHHVVTAIRAGEMSQFRQAYRNIDVLLVDDVHVFSRKNATQEEFFHTFNTLHLEGKQIILSASCSPQELQHIEPRLTSRFEWGIALPIYELDKEERCQMLRAKAQALNFPLSPRIEEFLLETFNNHSGRLVKALETLILRLHLNQNQHGRQSNSIGLVQLRSLLEDLILSEEQTAITPLKILEATAELYGIRMEDILGKTQSRDCALPRQLSMYLCRHQLKMPFMKIGDLFDRDHSTVMTSVKQIQKAIDENNLEIIRSWHTILKKLKT